MLSVFSAVPQRLAHLCSQKPVLRPKVPQTSYQPAQKRRRRNNRIQTKISGDVGNLHSVANGSGYLWMAPSLFIMVLFLGSTERFVRTPHAEKHTWGFLESSRASTNWCTEIQHTQKNIYIYNFYYSPPNPANDNNFKNTPLFLMIKCCTSSI